MVFFTLKDHVIKNSATTSFALFRPTDLTLIVLASPEETHSSIVPCIFSPSSQTNVVVSAAFLKYSDSTFITSMDTAGFLLYKCSIDKVPVLISAAMLRQAKYVERNGFFENHLYGTVTVHLVSLISLTLTPEKKALGNFDNKNNLNLKGCLINRINDDAPEFIYCSLYCFGSSALGLQSLKNPITLSLS